MCTLYSGYDYVLKCMLIMTLTVLWHPWYVDGNDDANFVILKTTSVVRFSGL